MALPLYEVSDIETGMTACVFDHVNGYSVALRDDDSGLTCQTFAVLGTMDSAIEHARKLTGKA